MRGNILYSCHYVHVFTGHDTRGSSPPPGVTFSPATFVTFSTGVDTPEPVTFEVAAEGGRATVHVLFSWDVTTSALSYEVTVSGISAAEILGVGLHQAQSEQEGGVIYRLSGPGGQAASGTITLNTGERTALMGHDLYLRLYTTESPSGGPRAPLSVP